MVENDMLKNENEMLKHEIESLHYDGKNNLKHLLGFQIFSLNKEGLGYAPKKGKEAFLQQRTNFVKNKGKNMVDVPSKKFHDKGTFVTHNIDFMRNKGKVAIGECSKKNEVSFNIANSCNVLKKNASGNVIAKFVGNPMLGGKKSAISVPKVLVPNLQGPKQV